MKIKRHRAALGLLAASTLTLTACGTDQNVSSAEMNPALKNLKVECGTQPVVAEGSSAQKNAMDIFARAYGLKCQGQQLNYTASGSGKGVAAFTAGQVQFAGSDEPLSKEAGEVAAAQERCKGNPAWNLPMVFGPVAVTYNLPGVENLVLTPEAIAKIYQGEITKWNDPAIAELNPNAQLPAIDIVPFYRSDESGTSANFQKYLATATDGLWTGEGKTFRPGPGVGQGRSGTDGVTSSVEQTKGGITYAAWAFPKNAGLGIASIDSGSGPVALTSESVGKAIDGAKIKGQGNDLRLNLESIYGNSQPGVYPLVLATYEIVCSKGYSPEVAKGVKAALKVAANADPEELEQAGYVALPPKFKSRVVSAIEDIEA
ncbi:phosphate ABC transporter substrate-binding protein (PhoT family) [Halopolyspora algeriensis]|uniref:Phosphate-binding protein n=1 Tax=Halopolyspora algeriensis TaxID=1500506 RepID=A0A368VYQ0_9ACTN|nr:phosphate ABC transporter substrate-binding protein PstS [Halopolyspora algeriensis]RCW47035.1 phosphate ABC transporter substrate-binding protein (PhoT family) [Halopolyspora algeriensis]TQM48122.1 phosphate ABC transporter substrate-binding protein (PhoT family) [Halopolyspora algeriensis]